MSPDDCTTYDSSHDYAMSPLLTVHGGVPLRQTPMTVSTPRPVAFLMLPSSACQRAYRYLIRMRLMHCTKSCLTGLWGASGA